KRLRISSSTNSSPTVLPVGPDNERRSLGGSANNRRPHKNSRATRRNMDLPIIVSRPSEKFLIEPSRKFLLTAFRLKDGTNRDESRGTRQVGVAETGQRRGDHSARGGRQD